MIFYNIVSMRLESMAIYIEIDIDNIEWCDASTTA